jgi:clan AA aspartic protease (TIGR02281 family)
MLSDQAGKDLARFALTVCGCVILSDCSQPSRPANTSQTAASAPAVINASTTPTAKGNAFETEVPVEQQGGTFVVPVTINGTISLNFTIDSGASDVSIPADVASTLVRSGTITGDDFIGNQTFTLADGTQVPSAEFRIRTLKVGTLLLHDVTGSLTDAHGSLLLGQTFLSRLSSWSIDNGRHVLRLKAAPGMADQSPTSNAGHSEVASEEDVGSLLSTADLDRIAAQFNSTYKESGMAGISGLVDECYSSIPSTDDLTSRKRAAYCVTLDLVGLNFDAAFRKEMLSRLSHDVPPVPFYEDSVWVPRMKRYLPLTTPTHAMPSTAPFLDYEHVAERDLSDLAGANSGDDTANR